MPEQADLLIWRLLAVSLSVTCCRPWHSSMPGSAEGFIPFTWIHSAVEVHPGAAVMDGALLLIAANESCPQPQTSEHLAAVEIMRLQHIIILQNKIDLINESTAANQHDDIQVGY